MNFELYSAGQICQSKTGKSEYVVLQEIKSVFVQVVFNWKENNVFICSNISLLSLQIYKSTFPKGKFKDPE